MSRPAIARINIGHLQHNYRLLSNLAGHASIMAIVKANAYGHGQNLVAPALLEAGCRSFGVTDATEGAELRSIPSFNQDHVEITLLSGIFDEEDAKLCVQHHLTPAATEPFQLSLLAKSGHRGKVWLKFDSGMNRLGAETPSELYAMAGETGIDIRGFMSHLACADEPDHPLNRIQAERFITICDQLSPNTPKSLLNSAGIIAMPQYAFDVVRPGIALYGAEPVPDRPVGLKPVMSLNGEVMQVRQIHTGASVSYGATFTADKTMDIAVVSMGYADGIPRSLSNIGDVHIRGQKYQMIGRICMDYTMVDVTGSGVRAGDSVEFWGEHISANQVAAEIDTISYTLFTGVGERVRRIAV
ncbi:alanine racemase [Mariprofundus ferrinatatus]|nr:alanine racemase [Mariprofundus ferrinatatus]